MLEFILNYSIRNRRLVVLIVLGVAALGIYALQLLPIDAVPDITGNQISINTSALALTPEEIEKQITYPVENAIQGIPGLQMTRSLSRNGFSQVTAIFEDDVSVRDARIGLDQRLRVAKESLPAGVEPKLGPESTGLSDIYMWALDYEPRNTTVAASSQPTTKEAKDNDAAKFGWQPDGSYITDRGEVLTTEKQRVTYLRTIQDWVIAPQMRSVKGIAEIETVGGYEKQYTVEPDPLKLVSYGLTFSDISTALQRNNSNLGAGALERNGESNPVRIVGLLKNTDDIGAVKVGQRNGTPIRVRDVATVGQGSEIRTGASSYNGHEVVIGTVLMLIGGNSRTVSEAADRHLAEISKTLPPGIRAIPVYNRKKLVDSTIKTVSFNLMEGALLVVVILLLLLGNLRAAVITALAIPLSMFITAIGMVKFKISGNLMSLGAIDFGIIVDGSVIIVENCLRQLAMKQKELGRRLTLVERLQTVFAASKQVRSATAFGEAIIIIVYIPILALTGIEGKMFHPMAMTVIFALIAAFVLSLTFVPAMIAIFMGGKIQEKENFIIHLAHKLYTPLLSFAIKLRWAVVALAIGAFIGAGFLYKNLGGEFTPKLDEMDITILTTRIPTAGLETSRIGQMDIEKLLLEIPQVELVFSKIGTADVASDPMPITSADTIIMLKPRSQWPDPHLPKKEIITLMEEKLVGIPGVGFEYTQPIEDRFNEMMSGTKSAVAVKLFGDDFDELKKPIGEIVDVLKTIPGAKDVKPEETTGLQLLQVTPDPEALARLNLDKTDIQEIVATAVGGHTTGVILEGDRRFDLVVRLPEHLRLDIAYLRNLPIPIRGSKDAGAADSTPAAATGSASDSLTKSVQAQPAGYLPLSSIAQVGLVDGLNEISRENGKRRLQVTCNIRGRDTASFVAEAKKAIAEKVKLPPGIWPKWGGQYENIESANQRLMTVVPICFVLIFILLYSTFQSIKDAIVVFSGVPLALSGGVVALYLRGIDNSISAGVGFIALSGVAVLNGLVMVTFINQLRKEGTPLHDAIVRGSTTRLRPVLMTALVASLGFIPMAIATGTGAEVQRPLATVVIGGILTSTVLTLFVLPALYRMLSSDRAKEKTDLPTT